MDDMVKFEGLTRFLCEECVSTKRYHLRGEKSESWWCPHSKNLLVWSDVYSGVVLDGIDDTAYFTMIADERELARKLANQAQARLN